MSTIKVDAVEPRTTSSTITIGANGIVIVWEYK